jgi:hypothetical protein
VDKAIFTVERDLATNRVRYTLDVDSMALAQVDLDPLDRALVRECGGDDSTIADKLLALETLMRRMQEQQTEPHHQGSV